jgi:YegS/Rv2252/BmrU family lipid kinase
MQSDRFLIIHNPHAGALQAEEQRVGSRSIIAEIRRALSVRHEWVETQGPGDATRIASHARDGFGAVVAVGGDGTVHEVIAGLMSIPRHLRPAVGVIPSGSGNDFAFAVGLPVSLRGALDLILRGNTRAVDIGRVEDDLGRRTYFDNSLGIGFDANVTMEAVGIRKLRCFARYFAATLKSIARHHTPFEVDMEIDRLRLHERALMITLGNGPREGGGFMTTPNSQVDDGAFELLLIKPVSRPMMLALLPKVMRGMHLESPSVYHRSFSTLQLTSRTPLCIHIDGEMFGDDTHLVRSLRVDLEPHAIRVLC